MVSSSSRDSKSTITCSYAPIMLSCSVYSDSLIKIISCHHHSRILKEEREREGEVRGEGEGRWGGGNYDYDYDYWIRYWVIPK